MVNITINGNPVHAREGASVLEASREDKYASKQFDINILSLNYLRDVQQEDTSGLCIAEVAGKGIVNASTVTVEEGMEIVTNSPEIIGLQKKALQNILDHHDLDCRHCLRTGNCELQEIQYNLRMIIISVSAAADVWLYVKMYRESARSAWRAKA